MWNKLKTRIKKRFNEPICTILGGEYFTEGETIDTVDAFGAVNGKQIMAPAHVVDQVSSNLAFVRDIFPFVCGVHAPALPLSTSSFAGKIIIFLIPDLHHPRPERNIIAPK